MRVLIVFAGVALGLAAVATEVQRWAVEAANVDIAVRDNFYEDADGDDTTTIALGDTVTWTWMGVNAHTVTADLGAFDSGDSTQTTGTFTHTFSSAGTFAYYCVNHGGPGGFGMHGIVIVQEPPTATATNTSVAATATNTSVAPTATSTSATSSTPTTTGTVTVTATATGTVTVVPTATPVTPVATPTAPATATPGVAPPVATRPAGAPGGSGAAPRAGTGIKSGGRELGALSVWLGLVGVTIAVMGATWRRRRV